jgi:hypothetical protein
MRLAYYLGVRPKTTRMNNLKVPLNGYIPVLEWPKKLAGEEHSSLLVLRVGDE